jgi:CDGSH-type Zn-finger protein
MRLYKNERQAGWKMKNSQKKKENQDNYKVKISPDGPYLVSGGVPLADQIECVDPDGQCHGWKEGRTYPLQENYTLCRCGKSKNKPYCDGSHVKAKFDGAETAPDTPYRNQARTLKGPALTLNDAEEFCANARFCDRGEGVWKLTMESGDPPARKQAIEEACDCPSGRLVAQDSEGNPIEPEFEPSIGLVHDTQAAKMGPIWVRGGITIESARGEAYEKRNRVTLCRCGKSRNKPFCDGSHME